MGPLLLRGAPPAGHADGARQARRGRGPPGSARAPTTGILAAVEALVARFQSPALAGLPPLHGGLVGYLGYDVVREVERLPDVPDRRPGPSRRRAGRHRPVLRLRPLAPAHRPGRQRGGARALRRPRRRGRPRRGGARRLRGGLRAAGRAGRGLRPAGRRLRTPGRWWPHRAPGSRRPRRSGRSARRSTRRRSAWPRSTSAPATSSRSCCRNASTWSSRPTPTTSTGPCACSTRARTCTSCASPRSPSSARRPSRWCGCATASSSRGRSPARGRGARTSSTTACSRASWPRTPRSWPSTSCWWTWPATTSGASCASAPRRSTSS